MDSIKRTILPISMLNISTLERSLLRLTIKLDKLFLNFEKFSLTAPEISWTVNYIDQQINKAMLLFKYKEKQMLIDYNILVNQINIKYIQDAQTTSTIPRQVQLRNEETLFSVNEYIDMNRYIHRTMKNMKIIMKNDKINDDKAIPSNAIPLTKIEKVEQRKQILLKKGKYIHNKIVIIIADIFRKYPESRPSRMRINNIIYNQFVSIYNYPKKIIIAKLKLEKTDRDFEEQITKLEELKNIDFRLLGEHIVIKLLEKRKPELEIIKEILCSHIKIYQDKIDSKNTILVNNFTTILQYKIDKINTEYTSTLKQLDDTSNKSTNFKPLNELSTMIVLIAKKLAIEREKKQINWSIEYFQNKTKITYPGNVAKLTETTKEYTELYQPEINNNATKYLELINLSY